METKTIITEEQEIELTEQEVEKLLTDSQGKGVELNYIDYRDCIENDKDIELLVNSKDGREQFEEKMFENWSGEGQYESIDYIITELEKDNGVKYTDNTKELIREWCYSHDTSDILGGLLKNTGSKYFYYDLGMEVEGWGSDYDKQEREIMKLLRTRSVGVRKAVREALINSDGGQLVVLFEEDIDNLIGDGSDEAGKVIAFGVKASICVMDRLNGSGWYSELGEELVASFDRNNLHSDEGAGGYSFTGDVCGMTRGFMSGATIRNKRASDKVVGAVRNEEAEARQAREARYEKKWRETKECSAGDMDIKRHENTPYRNEYPCGNKCEKCGTFWID